MSSTQASSSSSSSQLPSSSAHDAMPNENRRRSVDFHPSIWGDIFLSSPSKMNTGAATQLQYEELKQEVIRKFKVPIDHDNASQKLRLIDTIKRLGVNYHFETEIEDTLQNIHDHGYCKDDEKCLEIISLQFRLLREYGFNVPCEIFKKFKDDEGNFKICLQSDVKGLLELYEATHLRVHGEHILEEAFVFAATYLDIAKANGIIEYPLSEIVSQALKRPVRKGLPRLEARRFISIYQDDGSHDEKLLTFAKLDFNLLQNSHKEELSKISRWWKDLDLKRELSFARDRLVECYFWILGVYFEPQYSFAREISTKIIAMASVMDDIYDVYGTFEELKLFTNVIKRWDVDNIDQLPAYMKVFYKALLDVYEEMEEVMTKQGKLYRVQYAKETMKQLCEAYFVEAKWYHENYVPTMKEYMTNALISSGYVMVTVIALVGMEDDMVTKETFSWASKNPKIIEASCLISRLMDDIVSHKFEQERGHVASAVECYMKQHEVPEEHACTELKKQIESAWKDINEELIFSPTSKVVPVPVLARILNLARVMDFLYKEGDGYTHVGNVAKNGITSLLIDPISISRN